MQPIKAAVAMQRGLTPSTPSQQGSPAGSPRHAQLAMLPAYIHSGRRREGEKCSAAYVCLPPPASLSHHGRHPAAQCCPANEHRPHLSHPAICQAASPACRAARAPWECAWQQRLLQRAIAIVAPLGHAGVGCSRESKPGSRQGATVRFWKLLFGFICSSAGPN